MTTLKRRLLDCCRCSHLPRWSPPVALAATLAFAATGGSRELVADGLSSTNSQLIYETAANPIHPPAAGDELGWAVATGDFDGDGADDLAIGLRNDDNPLAGLSDIGQVQIRFGAAGSGLDELVSPKYLWQGGAFPVDDPEPGDHFGESLAVGDFDGDGFDDLAIGIPGEDVGTISNAGAIEVRYGAANRSDALTSRRQFWSENTTGVPDAAGTDDEFGHALAAGDFDGDTFDDLAIGVPLESVNGVTDAGRAIVLYGSAAGIGAVGAQTLDEDTPNVPFDPVTNDHFGFALVAADFDNNGFCDLAVGVPDFNTSRGVVLGLRGSSSGVLGDINYRYQQGTFGVGDVAEVGDVMGYSLGVGDFNGDPFPDLAVGVPGESVNDGGEIPAAGGAHVLFGSATGFNGSGSLFWTALSSGVPGDPEVGDELGFRVAAGDFDHDGFDELVIGVPYEQNFLGPAEGDVVVLPGTVSGPTGTGAAAWNLQVPGILGDMNPGDKLGWSLAVGDFDANGHADLAIGTPYDGGIGGVLVLYGALFADNFETGTTALWSAAVP